MDSGSVTATRKLFGTDGVRGRVGERLDPELAVAIGRAATAEARGDRPQVAIVRDTRESGPMLEAALAAGIAAAGGDAYLGGVLPTPAASILVRRHRLDLAAVVSASHNPWHDNGIKFFGPNGVKLGDEVEARIEERIAAGERRTSDVVGRIRTLEGAFDDYLRELTSRFRLGLGGRKVVLDCANGATSRAAPMVFERLGASVETVAADPDGRNINDECGATHPQALAERVEAAGADIGYAFDGDGDRVLAVDRTGRVRDGDEMIALAAAHLRDRDALPGGVAVTVMTNYGFHTAMADAGIEVATTKVGDRYVIEELLAREWELGGEQSGHVIWMEFAPTGDGIAAALLLETALAGRDLADAVPFERLPQRLVNVTLEDRDALEGATELWVAVEREGVALEGRGRVLVRPSGTEPVVRLMVEAPDEEECEAVLGRLTEVAERELG
ncbi:MAG TPA: phosphoglucosamine mutase [Solirubrobacterales bacterium]|nr:phosphoglucosamine mutase [Solirubrobacterales bacterium]